MNKKLKWLLWPNLWVFFLVLTGFAVAAAVMEYYVLAAAELAISVVLVLYYILCRNYRRKEIQNFVKKSFQSHAGLSGADTPFPMVLIRMGDESVIWANERFSQITGFRNRYLSQPLSSVLPGFSTDWLASGKQEYPYDVKLSERRYRAYGTTLRADDPDKTVLGMLYFSDLTELYQVRDEYIRSRPVVSLILIDNYEELTKNLTEGAISSLNAQLNNVITSWTENYHGLLRKLERNRFLFVFEKRDLNHAIEGKFSLLEDIHRIESPSGLEASISLGLGLDGATFEESYEFAACPLKWP